MHVNWSETARWRISAATVESTPPLNAQTMRPLPTWRRILAVASSTKAAIVQSPVQPQMPKAKFRRISRPRSVWTTSGWKRIAYRPRRGSDIAAIGAFALVATTANPLGAATTKSP